MNHWNSAVNHRFARQDKFVALHTIPCTEPGLALALAEMDQPRRSAACSHRHLMPERQRGSRETYGRPKGIPEIRSLLSMHFEDQDLPAMPTSSLFSVCREFRAFRHNVGSEARADFGVLTSQDRPVFPLGSQWQSDLVTHDKG